MKIFSSPKMLFGTIATTGLMALAMNSCGKKEPTPLEKAQSELKEVQEQYTRDSLDFVNSDSIKAKAKLAKLQELRNEYLGISKYKEISKDSLKESYKNVLAHGNPKGLSFEEYCESVNASLKSIHDIQMNLINSGMHNDKNIEKMDSVIYNAQAQIDIATGKVLEKSKENVDNAKALVKAQEILARVANGEKVTKEEITFAENMGRSNKLIQEIVSQLKNLADSYRKDRIMIEFNNVAAE